MLKSLADWLEARTGYRALMHEALDEPIPGGARWRYVFGSALTVAFFLQLATGLLLMMSYSPSSSTAWGSVFFISERMSGGWFLRGLHHFGSQAMVILLVMHLLQVTIAGAFRAPREINWWFGLALMAITLGFSLTGYLLPWDQKGFWATKVATKIAGTTPVVGPYLEKVIVGGTEYGNQTLTRFYGLHVGILPALLVVCLTAHVLLFRKHGITHPEPAVGMDRFWPKQIFMDTAASVVVLGVMVGLVLREHGANLDAPADPSSLDYPARPEWYFLSLYQLLKKFPGKYELVGTMVVPGAIATVLVLLPLLDRVFPRRLVHFFACAFLFGLVGGAGFLTFQAWQSDRDDPKFQEGRALADRDRDRALTLARALNLPPDGAAYLLRRDPLTRGRAILDQKCLGCHAFDGKTQADKDADFKGADLAHYGTRAWVRGLLENPDDPRYTLRAPKKRFSGMHSWKQGTGLETAAQLDAMADFVATFAAIPEDLTAEEWANDPKVKNHPTFQEFVDECLGCHKVGKLGEEDKLIAAPSLFGWGSDRWIARMIRRPGSPDHYGFLPRRQQMPPFDEDQIVASDLSALIRYLKDDYVGAKAGGPARPAVSAPSASRD